MAVFGEALVEPNTFLTRYQNEVKSYISRPWLLSAAKDPCYELNVKLGWFHKWSGCSVNREISCNCREQN